MALIDELQKAGFSKEEAAKLVANEHFAAHNGNQTGKSFSDRLRKAAIAYSTNIETVRKAVLSFPPFAGLDHERVVRQKSRLGGMVGLGEQEIVGILLKNPVLAGYSTRRDIAALKIGKEIAKEGLPNDKAMLDLWLRSHYNKSPYVPGTARQNITQARKQGITTEPPLMNVLRKAMLRAF
jgi:hypothetical protein